MNNLSKFQFYDKYARYNSVESRRETWQEAVSRAVEFLIESSGAKLDEADYAEIHSCMLNMKAFSSMRLFATAWIVTGKLNCI